MNEEHCMGMSPYLQDYPRFEFGEIMRNIMKILLLMEYSYFFQKEASIVRWDFTIHLSIYKYVALPIPTYNGFAPMFYYCASELPITINQSGLKIF